jgi:hypothetical protein
MERSVRFKSPVIVPRISDLITQRSTNSITHENVKALIPMVMLHKSERFPIISIDHALKYCHWRNSDSVPTELSAAYLATQTHVDIRTTYIEPMENSLYALGQCKANCIYYQVHMDGLNRGRIRLYIVFAGSSTSRDFSSSCCCRLANPVIEPLPLPVDVVMWELRMIRDHSSDWWQRHSMYIYDKSAIIPYAVSIIYLRKNTHDIFLVPDSLDEFDNYAAVQLKPESVSAETPTWTDLKNFVYENV